MGNSDEPNFEATDLGNWVINLPAPTKVIFEFDCLKGCVVTLEGNEPAKNFVLHVGNLNEPCHVWVECPHGYKAGWYPPD